MKITTLILVCLFLYSCKTSNFDDNIFDEGKTYKNFRGYEPVDPVEFEDQIRIASEENLIVSKDMKLLTREETLGFLNNETVLVSIGMLPRRVLLITYP